MMWYFMKDREGYNFFLSLCSTIFERSGLKRVWLEIFDFRLSSRISFPRAPEYPIETISNVYENSREKSKGWSPVALTPVIIGKKIWDRVFILLRCCWVRNGPKGILRGPGETDSWKKPEYEISRQTPFKGAQAWDIRYRVIYTERSHLGRWLEEWTQKSFCVKC